MWFILALASSFFAALTSILAKVGIDGINSNLATALRTFVVLLMSWVWCSSQILMEESRRFPEEAGCFWSYPASQPELPGFAITKPFSWVRLLKLFLSTSSA